MDTRTPDARLEPSLGGATATATLAITGMTCAACVSRLERLLTQRPGVRAATVSLPAESARVEFDPDRTELAALVAAIEDAGFGARPVDADDDGSGARAAESDEVRRTMITLVVSALLSLPLLAQMGAMLAGTPMALPGWLLWALATPVQFWAGARFYRGAWYALRSGGANMDVLVALGTSAAYGLSVWQVVSAERVHPDFEAAALVITLVIAGKWLEARARRATNRAIEALRALRPETARLARADGGEEVVPLARVRRGDVVVVRPGERIPVDGVVVEGRASVNEAMVTGEAMPRDRGPGAPVIGGTLNLDGLLRITTGAVGADSTLGRMIALVGHAQATKPHIQHLADVISGRFAFLVAGVALLTFAGWFLTTGALEASILPAVAVLVVACPCALGLATPAVIAVALGRAAGEGILIRDAEALEIAHEVGAVVFDKTGTLTDECPEMAEVVAVDGDDEALLALAAAVQRGGSHPIARAILDRVQGGDARFGAVSDFRVVAGRGVRGTVAGRALVLGNRALIDENGLAPESALASRALAAEEAGQAVVWIAETGPEPRVLGLIAVADRLRPGAVATVAALRRAGLVVVMLTGDAAAAAQATAARLGIAPNRVVAGARPEDKIAEIERWQAALASGGRRAVAMVGDGVNDAPALARADLGVAMGGGTDVAIEAAGVSLMRADPRLVVALINLATATRRKIVQNLCWAFGFNLLALPLAALGLFGPVIAAVAMTVSSLTVVGNALSLRRWRPPARLMAESRVVKKG